MNARKQELMLVSLIASVLYKVLTLELFALDFWLGRMTFTPEMLR